jgi:hypothetical protein
MADNKKAGTHEPPSSFFHFKALFLQFLIHTEGVNSQSALVSDLALAPQPLQFSKLALIARGPPAERDCMSVPLDELLMESVIKSQDKMPVWHHSANWKYMGETQTPCLTMNS